MEKIAYIILTAIAIFWLIAVLVGFIAAFPFGIIGFLALVGFGLLFAKALKDRLASIKDDRYSRDVEK